MRPWETTIFLSTETARLCSGPDGIFAMACSCRTISLIAHGEISLGYREVPPLCQLDQLAQTPKWQSGLTSSAKKARQVGSRNPQVPDLYQLLCIKTAG